MPEPPSFAIDKGSVVRRDAGQVRWSTRLSGARSRSPLWDAKRVYVRHRDGVTALSATTGVILWHSKGPRDYLLLSGDLLVAANDSLPDSRWLTGRAVTTGAEVWKARLPAQGLAVRTLREVAGLFLLQDWLTVVEKGTALLFDREGKVRHRLHRPVLAGVVCGEDHVLLTSTDVVRLSPGDQVRWATSFAKHEGIAAGGGLVEVRGGDLVAFRYDRISDSGVQLVRLRRTTGEAVWRACCDRLGLKHSKYRHDAKATVEGERLRVTSRGSFGTFEEVLDLRTGKRLKRIAAER
jgi:outer membrane protein assembly factor BamB